MREFEELRLRFREVGTGRYLVLANGPASATAVVDIAENPAGCRDEYDTLVAKALGQQPLLRADVIAQRRELGRRVFAALLPKPIQDCIVKSLDRSQRLGHGLRLRFDLPDELRDFPLECMTSPSRDSIGPIALNSNLSIARSLPSKNPQGLRSVDATGEPSQLQLLVAVASPKGKPLDAGDELMAIRALNEWAVRTTAIERATRGHIQDWVNSQTEPSAVLLIAHGSIGQHGGVVHLEGPRRRDDPVDAATLSSLLSGGQRLRFVVLNLCMGTRAAPQEPFSGLAQHIVGWGVPAVVAMQTLVGNNAAAMFAPALLHNLLANQTVDEALVAARARIPGDAGAHIEWCTPTLYLHQDCGHGWLHKAPGAARQDPMRAGAETSEQLKAGKGDVTPERQLLAARHRRLARDWDGVISAVGTTSARGDLRLLIDEARIELSGDAVDSCCRALAQESGDAEARSHLNEIADKDLPADLMRCLTDEADRAAHLSSCYDAGVRAQEGLDWYTAEQSFAQVLATSPAGYRDAADRLRVVRSYEKARQLMEDEDWAGAAEAYANLRSVCPDDPAVDGLRAYAAGRDAEAAPDWATAHEEYSRCPDDLLDAAERRAYAQGRSATDWAVAREAFAVAAGMGTRAEGWLAYATAREAEEGDAWALAAAAYAKVAAQHAAEFPDAANRAYYATGRAAEQADGGPDWNGVVIGFGPLPNDYAGGDVGRRRSFARARLAETWAEHSGGSWQAVLESLSDLSDNDFDGKIAMLRGKASGRHLEQAGDWAAARDSYAPVADASQELADLHRYAQARAAERDDPPRWREALEHYRLLDAGHRDVVQRQAYSLARHEEELARAGAAGPANGWQSAVNAYAEAAKVCRKGPGEFADIPVRLRYASARLAEARGEWDQVRTEVAALPQEYDDAPLLDAYAVGRLAELAAAPDPEQVRLAFSSCVGHHDAKARLAYWDARSSEVDGRWNAAAELYREAGDVRDAKDRHARLVQLLSALPWVSNLASATLVADPHATSDAESPYDVLSEVGITPASSDEEVRAVSFTLLRQGHTGQRWRKAWDRLRFLNQRLRLDALLYPVRDPAALRNRLNEAQSPEGLLTHLLETLPFEAPVVKLVSHGREEAIATWEGVLRRTPADMTVVHSLAIAHLWRAQELDANGAQELAEKSWQASIACWAVLLTNDGYWSSWRTVREQTYGRPILTGDIAQLRRDLRQDLVDRLAGHRERHHRQGQAERARAYQRLIRMVDVELDGARVLSEVGGLVLPGGEGSEQSRRTLATGPGYVQLAALAHPLAELVASRQSEEDSRDGGDEADLRRLRCAFSELATALMLMEHQWPEDALGALPSLDELSLTNLPADCEGPGTAGHEIVGCRHCDDFIKRNPAYLLLPHRCARLLQDTLELAIRAHLALARNALVSVLPDTGRALAEWSEAIGLAARAGTTVRTKQAVTRMVLGRVEALTADDGPQHGTALGEAIALLERVMPLVGAAGGSALRASLSELLTLRGVWYGYGCIKHGGRPNMAIAQADLRRALELNPGSLRARDNLVRALVYGLTNRVDRPVPPNSSRTWTQLGEALRILHEGMLRQPDPALFREILHQTLEAIESQVVSQLSFAAVAALAPDMGDGIDRQQRASALAANARERLANGAIPEALHDLVRATRLDPAEPRIRDSLLAAIESWRARLAADERRSV